VSDVHTYNEGKEKKSKRQSESERGSNLKDKVEIENKIKGENEDTSEYETDSEFYSETKRNGRRTSDSVSENGRTRKLHIHTRVNRVQEHDKERDKVRVEERSRKHKREVDSERDREGPCDTQIRSEGRWTDRLAVMGRGDLAKLSYESNRHHNSLATDTSSFTNWGTPSIKPFQRKSCVRGSSMSGRQEERPASPGPGSAGASSGGAPLAARGEALMAEKMYEMFDKVQGGLEVTRWKQASNMARRRRRMQRRRRAVIRQAGRVFRS